MSWENGRRPLGTDNTGRRCYLQPCDANEIHAKVLNLKSRRSDLWIRMDAGVKLEKILAKRGPLIPTSLSMSNGDLIHVDFAHVSQLSQTVACKLRERFAHFDRRENEFRIIDGSTRPVGTAHQLRCCADLRRTHLYLQNARNIRAVPKKRLAKKFLSNSHGEKEL